MNTLKRISFNLLSSNIKFSVWKWIGFLSKHFARASRLPSVTPLNSPTRVVPFLYSHKLRFELRPLAAVDCSRLAVVVLPRLHVNPAELIWLTEVTMQPVHLFFSSSVMFFSPSFPLLVATVTSWWQEEVHFLENSCTKQQVNIADEVLSK
jgi:hypothetical protein